MPRKTPEPLVHNDKVCYLAYLILEKATGNHRQCCTILPRTDSVKLLNILFWEFSCQNLC